eukprot:SAG11_NODE_13997_length_629_cov_1.198113_2_plen_37_part_01
MPCVTLRKLLAGAPPPSVPEPLEFAEHRGGGGGGGGG